MEHRTETELKKANAVSLETRAERLTYLADILDKTGGQLYRTLPGVESRPLKEVRNLPIAGTPLELAAKDPLLCAMGLTGATTTGPVMDFFSMTKGDVHALCHCLGHEISGKTAAMRIRGIAQGSSLQRQRVFGAFGR